MVGFQNQQELESVPNVNQSCGIKKKCTKCKEIKFLDEFYLDKRNKNGHGSWCKVCMSNSSSCWAKANPGKVQKSVRKWEKANPEKVREARRKRYNTNSETREKAYKRARRWAKANPKKVYANKSRWARINAKKIKERHQVWRKNNPDKIRKHKHKTYSKEYSDPCGRLNRNISSSVWFSLKGNKKGAHWEDLVGYTLEKLRKHLEKQFTEDMSWGNYGEWHVDHRIPVSVFNFTKPEHRDFKKCWALKNLQLMWAIDNIAKSNKIGKHFQPLLLL